MSKYPWHKRYHSDALNGYMSLSLEERGAYSTVLDLLYDRGEPILDNDRLLAGYFGVSVRKARAVVEALIAKGKIYRVEGGRLSNARFEKERENELKTSRKHAENGSNGGRARAANAKKANKNNVDQQARLGGGLSLNQKPEARKREREGKPSLVRMCRFSEFWDAYPHRDGKRNRGKAEALFRKAVSRGVPEQVIIDGARAAHNDPRVLSGYARDPTTWLNQAGWDDEIAPNLHHFPIRSRGQTYGERLDDAFGAAAARLAQQPFDT